MLDENSRLNLASFVTTWMESKCDKLIMAAINKNHVDMDKGVRSAKTALQQSWKRIWCGSEWGNVVKSFVETTMTVAGDIDVGEECKTVSLTRLEENLVWR
ncbi:hypothetical protein AHAS_Ahas12G0234200 [Arachis hypogaea]